MSAEYACSYLIEFNFSYTHATVCTCNAMINCNANRIKHISPLCLKYLVSWKTSYLDIFNISPFMLLFLKSPYDSCCRRSWRISYTLYICSIFAVKKGPLPNVILAPYISNARSKFIEMTECFKVKGFTEQLSQITRVKYNKHWIKYSNQKTFLVMTCVEKTSYYESHVLIPLLTEK